MADTQRVLIVDDDPEIRQLLSDYLSSNGYQTRTAADGKAMRVILGKEPCDLIILDLMLPGEDGLTLCRDLRSQTDIPIIMLTARGEETDRIVGLEMGADDYLPKPFNPRELLARIKVVLRRSSNSVSNQLDPNRVIFADWQLDLRARHLIAKDGVVVPLSGGEFRLLRIFLDHPQRVLNRDQIMDLIQGREALPFDRSIDVQVSRLRHRLRDDARTPTLIKTVRGEGYLLTAKVVKGA